jgi:hypothetical protein
MADKEYTRVNRRDCFANLLRRQNDSIAREEVLARPDLKVGGSFMSTPLAD